MSGAGVPEDIPPPTVYVQANVASGTNSTFTNRVAEELERRLPGIEGMGDAESVVATVSPSRGGGMFDGGADATVAVNFRDFQEREHDVFATLKRMQEQIGAGADIRVT